MHLTSFSDYTLRVLMYLALDRSRLATIGEIAAAYGVSRNHLMKVVHALGQAGVIETVRGKGGGIRLARDPAEQQNLAGREPAERRRMEQALVEWLAALRAPPEQRVRLGLP